MSKRALRSCNKDDERNDWLSDLPSDLIDNIMMRLPLIDAARTSILSTKWRYTWERLPHLIIDDTIYCSFRGKRLRDIEVLWIYQALLCHKAPVLRFTFSDLSSSELDVIDWIFEFLLRKGVVDLTLGDLNCDCLDLPSDFYSYGKLKHLNLANFYLAPPTSFQGFSNLVRLMFCDVMADRGVMQTFISSCPQLQQLSIEDDHYTYPLEIDAPNLRRLHIDASFRSVSLKNASRLLHLTVVSTMAKYNIAYVESLYIEEFFRYLPSIEKLTLGFFPPVKCVEAQGKTEKKLPSALCHLNHLCLEDIKLSHIDGMLCALWLIRNSPNLRSIIIRVHDEQYGPGSYTWSVRELLHEQHFLDHFDVSLNQLHDVRIIGAFNESPDLEFIKLLLSISPALKRFFIKPAPQQHELHMLARITKYQRLSPSAEIIWSWGGKRSREPFKKQWGTWD